MRILITEGHGFSDRVIGDLSSRGHDITVYDDSPGFVATRPEIAQCIANRRHDVLWVRFGYKIDGDLMDCAPRLRYICCASTGSEHIDHAAAAERGIKVLTLKGHSGLRDVRATAELTIGLMLALLRNIPAANGRPESERYQFKGRELTWKIVGIIGAGRVGAQVLRMLTCMNAFPIYYDTINHTEASFRTVLSTSKIVTLHADLNETSRGMMGREQFALMKPGSYFINTARCELVDEDALLEALVSGHLAGAATDFPLRKVKPSRNHGKWIIAGPRHEIHGSQEIEVDLNLIVTPHLGGCTYESMEKTELLMAEMLLAEIEKDERAAKTAVKPEADLSAALE